MGSSTALSDPPLQIPAIAYCGDKQRLLEAFTTAMRRLVSLQEQQIQAVIDEDSGYGRFDALIAMLSEQKRQAKYSYMEHVQLHGC